MLKALKVQIWNDEAGETRQGKFFPTHQLQLLNATPGEMDCFLFGRVHGIGRCRSRLTFRSGCTQWWRRSVQKLRNFHQWHRASTSNVPLQKKRSKCNVHLSQERLRLVERMWGPTPPWNKIHLILFFYQYVSLAIYPLCILDAPNFHKVYVKKKNNNRTFMKWSQKKMMLATKALQISCQFLPRYLIGRYAKGLSQNFIASGWWNLTLSLYAVSSPVETTEGRISEI